ncbi:hypothetical protein [Streptomyces sp. NPDC048361]|uniref:hypothetical protein n=1 Tax=Streptomyces sp. NPDC048361 TaxID=3154720 RepID=UPI00342C811F
MIAQGVLRLGAATLLVAAGSVACAGSTGHAPSSESTAARSSAAKPATPAAGTPAAAGAASTAKDAARRFAQALARGDAAEACGLADARLRSFASSRGGSCPEALAELAADDRYVFRQAVCVNAPDSYKTEGDPQDSSDSIRVDIDCAAGYTWLRVNRSGTVWRVSDFNAA